MKTKLTFLFFAVMSVPAFATVRYVDVNNTNAALPYTSWATAATNIQDAVDVAVAGDQILVTNGVYDTGGRAVFGAMTNRIAVDKPVAVRSVNGARFTMIKGYQVPGTTNGDGAIRCVYLTNGASLTGFTLTNGATLAAGIAGRERSGGGVWSESTNAIISACLLLGNSAAFAGGGARSGNLADCTLAGNRALFGGGAYVAELNNCTLTTDSAVSSGGGAYGATLRNCVLTENSAREGGGASGLSTLTNCTLQGNWVFDSSGTGRGGGAYEATLSHCTLITNFASGRVAGYGGGVSDCTLNDCVLMGNAVSGTNASGGGAYYGALTNCTLTGNRADVSGYVSGGDGGGGGAFWATLQHCTLSSNLTTGDVGNGGGAYGGTLNDCTLTGNSVWGYGGGAFRATLTNCTLAYNSAGGDGGGASSSALSFSILTCNSAYGGGGADSSTLNNCALISNFAYTAGGGAKWGTLVNCLVLSNSAGIFSGYGGGTEYATLINCTVTGNSAHSGGGTYDGTLTNCIVYFNAAVSEPNYSVSQMFYCCTTPDLGYPGNFADAPLFVDKAGGNLRLQSNSPCIGRGDWISAAGNTDLDGRPRIVGGSVDVGAYEFHPGISGEFIGWLSQYGLSTDGSSDYTDPDNDDLHNWQEWVAGTNPTNAASALRLLNPTPSSLGVDVTWQSVTNRTYFLQRTADLGAAPIFSLVSSNIPGQTGTTSFTDTNATGSGPFFYRIGLRH